MYDTHHQVRAPKPWIRWILLLVVLTLVLVIGYGIGLNQAQIIETTNEVTSTSTSEQDSPESENLKTFTAVESGYSLKHPADWVTDTNAPDGTLRWQSPEEAKLMSEQEGVLSMLYCDVQVTVYETLTDLPGDHPRRTFEEWGKSFEQASDQTLLVNRKQTTVAGKTAFEGQELGLISWYSVFVGNDDRAYRIATCRDATEFNIEQQAVIDSFMFL